MSFGGVANNALLSLVGNATRIGVSFLTAVLAARWLGPAGYGEFNILISYTILLNYLLTLGFESSLSYFVPRAVKSGPGGETGAMIFVALTSSVVTALLVLPFYIFVGQKILTGRGLEYLFWPFFLMALQTEFWALGSVIMGFLRGHKVFVPSILRDQIVFPLFHLWTMIYFVRILREGVYGYSVGYLISVAISLCYSLFSLYIFWRKEKLHILAIDFTDRVKSWVGFSIPLAITSSLEPLMAWVNIMVLSWFLPPSDSGYFSVFVRLTIFVQFFFLSIQPVIAPHLSSVIHSGDREEISKLFHLSNYWCTKWAMLALFFLLINQDYVLKIFNIEHSDGVFEVILLGSLFDGCFGPAKQCLLMAGKNRRDIINIVGAIMTMFLIGIYWAPKMGLMGSGIAYAMGYGVLSFLRVISIYGIFKILPLDRQQLLRIILIAISGVICIWLFQVFAPAGYRRLYYSSTLLLISLFYLFWSDVGPILKNFYFRVRGQYGMGEK